MISKLLLFPHTAPPLACKVANATILDLTLLRFKETRARRGVSVPRGFESRMDDLAATLQRLLTGFWHLPYLQHHCVEDGCCGGQRREVCVLRRYTQHSPLHGSNLSERERLRSSTGILMGHRLQSNRKACCAIKFCLVL